MRYLLIFLLLSTVLVAQKKGTLIPHRGITTINGITAKDTIYFDKPVKFNDDAILVDGNKAGTGGSGSVTNTYQTFVQDSLWRDSSGTIVPKLYNGLKVPSVISGSITGSTVNASGGVTVGSLSTSGSITGGSFSSGGKLVISQDSLVSTDTLINWNNGNNFIKVLTSRVNRADTTEFVFQNSSNGQIMNIAVCNDSTYKVKFSSGNTPILWSNGTAPVQTTGTFSSRKTDVYSFIRIGDKIYANVRKNF